MLYGWFRPTQLLWIHWLIYSPSSGEFTAPLRHILPIHNHKQQQFVCGFPLDFHLLRWEILWRNAPRIWRDFGSALQFQTRLTQTKPVLPLSNEHGLQVKDQDRRQCCHNKHKKFPYRPTRNVSLLSGHASYIWYTHDTVVVRYMRVCSRDRTWDPSNTILEW